MPQPVAHTPVRFTHLSVHRGDKVVRYPLGGPQAVTAAEGAKANFPDPKAPGRSSSADDWPGWKYDLEAAAFWAPRIAAALAGALDPRALAAAWLATSGAQQAQPGGQTKEQREAQAVALAAIAIAWLASYRQRIAAALTPVLEEVYTDGYVIGAASSHAYLAAQSSATVVEA